MVKNYFGVGMVLLGTILTTESASASYVTVESYTQATSPISITGAYPNSAYRYNNLLYMQDGAGIQVVDTLGTAIQSDDVSLGRYNTDSTPAIGDGDAEPVRIGNLLYVPAGGSGGDGLYVIDTLGTDTLSDDTLQAYYNASSTPALSSSYVHSVDVVGNILYISTENGLSVVNTQGTSTQSDDVLAAEYTDITTPSVGYSGNQGVILSFLSGNLLYVAGHGNGFGPELTVIDTQGTIGQGDDTTVGVYNQSTTPILDGGISGGDIRSAFRFGNLIYVATYGGGVTVIDTNGTQTLTDDSLASVYSTASTPAITGNYVNDMLLSGNLLYVASLNISWTGGLNIINTQGTSTQTDDTIEVINATTHPEIPNGSATFGVSLFSDLLYLTINTVELGTVGVHVLQIINDASDSITASLPINGTISITAPADVTMGAITGTGQSALTTNSATWNVKTNNASGYSLAWQASAAPMTNLTADTIAAYTPVTPDTPEPWSVASIDSEWGAHLASTSDIVDTGVWGTGDDYAAGNWLNVDNTAPYTIVTSSTSTTITGDDETVIFGGEIGSSKIQPTGDYSVDVTMTATTL